MKDFSKDANFQFVQYKKGDIVSGTVVMNSKNGTIVNIGGMKDAIIKNSLRTFKEGDIVLAIFTGETDESGCVVLDTENVNRIITEKEQIKSLKVGSTIEFFISEITNGGLEGKFFNYKVFVPFSQLTNEDYNNKYDFKNKSLCVVVLEIDNLKKKIICSTKLLQSQNFSKIDIKIGDILKGHCFKIFDRYALVQLENGLKAKIGIFDVSYEKIEKIEQILQYDKTYNFIVLQTNEDHTLNVVGYKQLLTNPLDEKFNQLKIGDKFGGKVVKLYQYGALIKLNNGLSAFAVTKDNTEKSNVATHHIFKLNTDIEVIISQIDTDNKKINVILSK